MSLLSVCYQFVITCYQFVITCYISLLSVGKMQSGCVVNGKGLVLSRLVDQYQSNTNTYYFLAFLSVVGPHELKKLNIRLICLNIEIAGNLSPRGCSQGSWGWLHYNMGENQIFRESQRLYIFCFNFNPSTVKEMQSYSQVSNHGGRQLDTR